MTTTTATSPTHREPSPFADVLSSIADQQIQVDSTESADARLTFDLGGKTQQVRGFFNVDAENGDVAVWHRVWIDRRGRRHPTVAHNDNAIPDSASESGLSEIPAHYRLDRLVLVEWATNDYDDEA